MKGTPEGLTESGFMEKPGIEPATPGLQGIGYLTHHGKLIFLVKRIAQPTISILLKEPFALKNSETAYFTSIFSTPSYSDIAPIDNFDLTFFYFYFVFEVFDTIQF